MTRLLQTEKKYLTKEGWEKLNSEYRRLVKSGRRTAAQRIQKAREDGEGEDNWEYQSALAEKDRLEGRVAELEDILRHAEVVLKKEEGRVAVGSWVRVAVEGEIDELTVVGSEEADPSRGLISYESLVGSALLGARVGEVIEVSSSVKTRYKILAIK